MSGGKRKKRGQLIFEDSNIVYNECFILFLYTGYCDLKTRIIMPKDLHFKTDAAVVMNQIKVCQIVFELHSVVPFLLYTSQQCLHVLLVCFPTLCGLNGVRYCRLFQHLKCQ